MRTTKTMLTLLLAIIWLPISSHCLLLESATNLPFLACCEDEAPTNHHEDACDSDACAVVEDAQYRCSLERVTAPTLVTHVVFELPPPLDTSLIFATRAAHPSNDALARLPVAWQFSFRTAAPPRAPSVVS